MSTTERLEFSGSQGATLAARFDRPLGPMRATALFAHCFTCSKDVAAAARIARSLAGLGIGVLRFDFTGLGHSGGEFASSNFSSNVADLVLAADFLRDYAEAPALLVGHSLGGTAVLAAAAQVPEAKAVVSIAAPADPEHLVALFGDAEADIERDGEAEVVLAGRTFRIRKQLLDDLRDQQLERAIAGLGRPLLVMHSPDDTVVGIDQAGRVFEAARHPKSFVSLAGADHLLSRPEDAEWAAGMIAAWADRVLPPRGAASTASEASRAPKDAPVVDEGVVWVREAEGGRFAQDILAGPHLLRAGEPEDQGGDGSGPGPYELLLAGLGACTSMTLRLYAQKKGWPLERVSVVLTHEKVHATDCDECETRDGKLDRIARVIDIEGDALTPDQRVKLMGIADKCPVHRTLHSEVVVRTTAGEFD